MPDDGQAEPKARVRARDRAVRLSEAVEDVGQDVVRNTAAGVTARAPGTLAVPLEPHLDRPLRWRELHGVREQIREHLLQSLRIALDLNGARVHGRGDRDVLGAG